MRGSNGLQVIELLLTKYIELVKKSTKSVLLFRPGGMIYRTELRLEITCHYENF